MGFLLWGRRGFAKTFRAAPWGLSSLALAPLGDAGPVALLAAGVN